MIAGRRHFGLDVGLRLFPWLPGFFRRILQHLAQAIGGPRRMEWMLAGSACELKGRGKSLRRLGGEAAIGDLIRAGLKELGGPS